jgi:WhiB family redox-sensing transcriptional regulator
MSEIADLMALQHIARSGDTEDTSLWRCRAACSNRDPNMWHPQIGEAAVEHAAKEVCHGCDVKQPCLRYALEHHEEHGVWGEMNQTERKRLAQAQRRSN